MRTRAAVLGKPVAHSLSPVLHEAAYRALGLVDWTYERIEMDAAGLRLNYGWLGFTQIATIARSLDASPTRVFLAINLTQFVAMGVAAGTSRTLDNLATHFHNA